MFKLCCEISELKLLLEQNAEAIDIQLLRYKKTREQQILHDVFHYIEKSKANTLKELLNENNAKNFAGLPFQLLNLEQELKTDRAFYTSQIIKKKPDEKKDSIKLTSYENKLFDINRKQDSLTEVLEKKYPKYHN